VFEVVLSRHIAASIRGDSTSGWHRGLLPRPRLSYTWALHTFIIHQDFQQVNFSTCLPGQSVN